MKLTIIGAYGNDRVTAFIGAPKYPIKPRASLERVVQGPAPHMRSNSAETGLIATKSCNHALDYHRVLPNLSLIFYRYRNVIDSSSSTAF